MLWILGSLAFLILVFAALKKRPIDRPLEKTPVEELRPVIRPPAQTKDQNEKIDEFLSRLDDFAVKAPQVEEGSEPFVYVPIGVSELNPSDIKVEVRGTQLVISGETEKRTSIGLAESFTRSSFERSLPLPRGVDARRFEIIRRDDVWVLKIPKQ
jgi:HSP20 family molecular chaperone IbpA